ncbi:unnamed protein product [Lactuca virosa]|uniref:Uncharacterized protein n=1 Tax=Lactuca virosa TaxID=75947 RepID=A0AAU9MW40_9ASTR|nr:unnamed protein product [Lactuca virosa]
MEPKNENIEGAESMKVVKQKKLGGIKTMPFILANEICDRFAATGFQANLLTYLTQQLNMPLVNASNTLTNFGGLSSLMPIIGALVADSFAGRYWTIIIALLIYELVHFLSIRNDHHYNISSLASVPATTMSDTSQLPGSVIISTIDQLDISKLKTQAKTTWNFFNWYYFFLSLASLSALTVVVYIQDSVSWGWGLGIPTIAMGIAFIAFLVGSSLYQKIKPEGSPFVRLAQVIAAAVKKRKSGVLTDDTLLYENKELDASISKDGRLVHTNQLRWFDKAAIITEKDTDFSNLPNLWQIATVHRVEELKSMIRLLPIISTGIIYVMAYSHQGSFTLTQARTMDRHLSASLQIPPASMAVFGVLATLVTLALYDRVFVPFAYRFTKNPSGITCLQRIGVGFVINIFATFVAFFVEVKRKQAARDHNLLDKPTETIPISVFWLIPQYSLHGVAEAMFNVGKLEFLYGQSPESMKSTALALYWSAVALGQYAGTLMVTMVHKCTNKNGRNWLPDRNLNRGRLEYYYMLVSGIQVLNLFYYFTCAWFYTYKPLEEPVKNKEDGDVELIVGI